MTFINRKRLVRSVFIPAIIALLAGCSEKPELLPNEATVTNNLYDNQFFRFQINIPQNWHFASEEAMKEVADSGKEMIAGDDENMKASLKALEKNVYNLFQVFAVAPGTPVQFYNSNMSCVAEKVGHLPGIKTGREYLLNVKEMLNSGKVTVIFDKEIQQRSLGGRGFYCMKAAVPVMGKEIKQQYFATKHDDFILGIVVSFFGSRDEATIQQALNSINFY